MAKRTCSVEGCERPYSALGYCNLHYQRQLYHGDPFWEPPSLEERFWEKVNKDGPIIYAHLGPCWLWTAPPVVRGGYGQIATRVNGRHRPRGAHVVAYELLVGPIPPEKPHVLHHCDNPLCVHADPDPLISHLYVGTPQDNTDDMWRRGRAAAAILKPCGTYAAYMRHYKRGEPICDACREAVNTYQRELKRRKATR